MTQFKKVLSVLMAMVMVIGLAACGGSTEPASSESTESTATSEQSQGESSTTEAKNTELDENSLYLITDLGTIDDQSFNQGSWEGLSKYAEEKGLKAKYIQPQEQSDLAYGQAIQQAIDAGAKVVVTPGYLFENAIGDAQLANPDVKFIAVDFVPKVPTQAGGQDREEKVADNTISITYNEQQSGFLAGYATVKDGYTKLGFMGGVAVPAVIRYGFGFLSGANYAAKEMGTQVSVKFNYTGSFTPKPEIQSAAASWYQGGTEVIFACGGGIYRSVLKAAQDNNAKMIGVDVDQRGEGEQIITSAMKNLRDSVYEEVKAALENNEGGKTLRLGVQEHGVQISDEFDRFTKFTKEEYDALYEKLMKNEDGITDSIADINFELPQEQQSDPTTLQDTLPQVQLEYVK